ncbi:Peroxisomal fatty acid beta-oxidation multifunctional protein MFP2 [Forsythia ovata]|uniref:Peroxisomal fatty acid beta-oxidation multifunctional protein MFP2 n=1 Tax=Forsythia ovata TaxID=205694 RepID=A0ABD1U6E5_9LAMI
MVVELLDNHHSCRVNSTRNYADHSTSKPVRGQEAISLGLVDAIASSNELFNTTRRSALDILERKRPWINSFYKTDKLEPLGEAREILKFARAQTRKRAPILMHPLVCIDVIEEGIISGPRAGLWKILYDDGDDVEVLRLD